AEGSMDDVASMCVVERLGELTNEIHAVLEWKLFGSGRDKRMKALGGLVQSVHEGWAHFCLRVHARAVEPWMGEATYELVLAFRRSSNRVMLLSGAFFVQTVDANPGDLVERNMPSLEVLITRSFGDEVIEDIVANLTFASR